MARFKGRQIGTTDKEGVQLREGDIVEYPKGCRGVVRYVDVWCHFHVDVPNGFGGMHIIDCNKFVTKVGSVYV